MEPGRLFFPTFLFLLAVAYFSSYALYGVNLFDEGYLLDPALRVLRGELPGRDFYHFYPPGRFYLLAGLMKLFGPSMSVERWLAVFLRAFEALLAWRLLARHTSRWWALTGFVGILLVPGPLHKVFFGLGAMLVLNGLDWLLDAPRDKRFLAFGALLGIIMLFRHDVALFGGATLAITLFARPRQSPGRTSFHLLMTLAGVLLVIVPPCLYWLAEGALDDIVYQAVVAGIRGNKANAIPYPWPWQGWDAGFRDGLKSLAFWTPPAAYLAILVHLVRQRRKDKAFSPLAVMELATLVMGILCMNQARLRSDLPHLYQAAAPVFVAVPLVCYSFFGRRAKRAWLPVAMAPALLFAVQSFGDNGLHHGTPSVMAGRNTRFVAQRANLVLSEAEAKQMEGVLDFLHDSIRPGAPILVVPDAPLFYFLSDGRNPARFEVFRAGRWNASSEEEEIVMELSERMPSAVIYRDQSYKRPEERMESYAPRLHRFIESNYCLAGRAGVYRLMLPENSAECPQGARER